MHPLPNAVMTVIMGILAVYWLFTLVLGVGLDDLDLGIDFDIDAPEVDTPDVDVDGDVGAEEVDAEHEVAPERSPGFFIRFLQFLNVGRVPFMLVLTVLKFIMWIGTLITTSFVGVVKVASWGVSSLFILIPVAVVSVFFTKFATNPMVRFFKEIGYKGEEEIDFLGRSGKMLSTVKGDKLGTAEFVVEDNPIKLIVKSQDGAEIKYGDFVVVMDESEDKKYYFVIKELSIRNFTND